MKTLLYISFVLTFLSCDYRQSDSDKLKLTNKTIPFQNTGLEQVVDSLLTDFAKLGHRKYTILIEGQSAAFDVDSLSFLLKNVKNFDIFNKDNSEMQEQSCNEIQEVIWKAKNNVYDSLKLIKYIYQSKYTDDGANNNIKITDYEITNANRQKPILLRIANDFDFEQLSVGETNYNLNYYEKIIKNTVYKPLFNKGRILGLDEVEKEYETKKTACR